MVTNMPDKVLRSRIKDQIDANLKRIYDDITKEELPERFQLLLDQLRAKSLDSDATDLPHRGAAGGES